MADIINDADKPGWESPAAHLTHQIFYACLFGLPLSGGRPRADLCRGGQPRLAATGLVAAVSAVPRYARPERCPEGDAVSDCTPLALDAGAVDLSGHDG